MEKTAFIIEENDTEVVSNFENKVVYSGKFCEYDIVKSDEFGDFFKITDKVENRDGVGLINSSLKELVFADKTIKFSEILQNFDKIISDDFANFNFGAEILVGLVAHSNIVIKIYGFDENKDSFTFDLETFPKDAKYKYSIRENEFCADMKFAKPFLISDFVKTFSFSTISLDEREVLVSIFVGENEIYKKILRGNV